MLMLLMIVLLTGCSEQYIVLDPKGPIGESQKDLIYITVILCAIVLVPVLILTAIIIWRYRDKEGNKASYKPEWEHNTKLEIIWWGIPIIIIAILGVITVKYTHDLEPSKPLVSDKEPLVIEATSLDWKWLFTYPEEGISTVNYIQIPEDRPIRFKVTADQAMNSFWIPQLGGQIYAMSGMAMTLNLQADEPGVYFGTGANFTGELFAKMTFDVNATSQEEFNAWVADVKGKYPALTDAGFEKLTEPGASNQQFFSSFPEGLFDRVVMQYINKDAGSTGGHHHGGAEAEAEKDSDASATESESHEGHNMDDMEGMDHGDVETASTGHAHH
ncbi:ubiquinol oxidase subunit II [Paenibacillus sp. NEAU-GSW1]|uniref:ubiquinol oxidase subunit II n=1 Tax=Paenibacillus sp. NEAU-GSW1 TaxID=2682486 RepID=UPI0012E0E687|nr:ubiquinol oxidase subunit II [Paenibacillus sp. NEAU-GSW1]MUT67898.1 ubiquinol oxidase subunit II [Paenibacillus sp. NEAU-GSW1]